MIYKEEYRDLFTLPANYILAHCVSRDLAMGAGIAKVFRDKYAIKKALTHRSTVPNSTYQAFGYGECLFTVTPESPWLVGNLITKERYCGKMTTKIVGNVFDNKDLIPTDEEFGGMMTDGAF